MWIFPYIFVFLKNIEVRVFQREGLCRGSERIINHSSYLYHVHLPNRLSQLENFGVYTYSDLRYGEPTDNYRLGYVSFEVRLYDPTTGFSRVPCVFNKML